MQIGKDIQIFRLLYNKIKVEYNMKQIFCVTIKIAEGIVRFINFIKNISLFLILTDIGKKGNFN